MRYSYEAQEKALKHLIKTVPHDIEAFKRLRAVEAEDDFKVDIKLIDILLSNVWNASEKVELIKLYGHEKSHDFIYKNYDREIGYSYGMEGLPLIDQCIKGQSLSGVEALLMLGNHISVATIPCIIEYVKNPDLRYQFCEMLVKQYSNQEIEAYIGTGNGCYLTEIPSLCDRYPHWSDHWSLFGRKELWRLITPMELIIPTNDLKLINLFMPTIKDIKPLFDYAVKFGTPEAARIFIENGADLNYQEKAFQYDNNGSALKTPIKVAIDNNDLDMVKFLFENGADLNFVDSSDEIKTFIESLKDKKEEKQYLIDWSFAPLEYAINLGPASLSEAFYIQKCFSTKPETEKHSDEKKLKDRIAIVKYLYENGAKFTDGTINYTNLISFSALAKDYDATKYYLEEARKKGYKPDFKKIISQVYKPNRSLGCMEKQFIDEREVLPIFILLNEYSGILDNENKLNDTKFMLEVILGEMRKSHYYFELFKDLITDITKSLPKEMVEQIPAVFNTPFEDLDYVLSLGYDIHALNNDKHSILMEYIKNGAEPEAIFKLISLGVDVNYQVPETGVGALRFAIFQLPKCDFGKYLDQLRYSNVREEYQAQDQKRIIKKLIDLSSESVVKSVAVEEAACNVIGPGYPQLLYNDVLEMLSKKGLRVSDEYFTKSIKFLGETYSNEYVTNPQGFLKNLYNNFSNKSIDTCWSFPHIEKMKELTPGSNENKQLFDLVKENLDRTFITSREQILEPDGKVGTWYDSINGKSVDVSQLMLAKRNLLQEIMRYVAYLSSEQVLELVDRYPMLDINMLCGSYQKVCSLLSKAIEQKNVSLCEGLMKRGATLVYYDQKGHDVTPELFDRKIIGTFRKLCEQYNPNQEFDDLLLAIRQDAGIQKTFTTNNQQVSVE